MNERLEAINRCPGGWSTRIDRDDTAYAGVIEQTSTRLWGRLCGGDLAAEEQLDVADSVLALQLEEALGVLSPAAAD